MTKKTCNTCTTGCVSPCIGVPKDASKWNVPNFTGCDEGSLPPGVCDGYDCIDKTPACAIEGGHALKLIKLSNYIDLDKFAGVDLNNYQVKLDNADLLSAIKCPPVTKIIDGVNSQAVQHCDGSYQVNFITPLQLPEINSVSYCDASGTNFVVAPGEINENSVQVFVFGQLTQDYTITYNGSNTIVVLDDSVTNTCVDIYFQELTPEFVQPEDCFVKVSEDDVAGFLEGKISGGAGVVVTAQNFGGSEYLEISIENPLPIALPTDVNQIVYVDENGDYQLGSPCCERAGLTVIGTDDVEGNASEFIIDFTSNDLDITVSDSDTEDGTIEINVEIKDETDLFTIENINGSVSETVSLGDAIVIKSSDGSVGINITDGCIDLTETPQTLLPIDYTFTDSGTRPVELGDSIEYVSETIDITNTGSQHIFEIKPFDYGGICLNAGNVPITSSDSIIVPFNQQYSTNNPAITSGSTLIATEDGLYDITSKVGILFNGDENNSVKVEILLNGTSISEELITIDATRYNANFSQHYELNTGDVISVRVTAFDSDINLVTNCRNTYLHMYRVR